MERELITSLLAWKSNDRRKPLLLDGVRQVGKTYLLQQFGAKYYPKTHYLDFEKTKSLADIFSGDLEPQQIINDISFALETDIDIHSDLVIFDEIQACQNALTSLKYFQQSMPELSLCSAGSLLGLNLNEGSFPVGKVDMLSLYPMSFREFLHAQEDDRSIEVLNNISERMSISEVAHKHLWKQLKYYFIVGGLPEAVAVYCNYKGDPYTAFNNVRTKQAELIKAYYADIAKHAGKVNAMHIDRVWHAIPTQLAKTHEGNAEKFKFKGVLPNLDRYSRMSGAIDWLVAAHLIIKVPIINSGQLPLAAYTQENKFKLLMFDVGVLGAMSGLSPKAILDYDYGTYKGYFAENFVAQEFLMSGQYEVFSWQEKQAEVEFVREINGKAVPIEVKSGWVRRAKSIKIFAEKYNSHYRAIFSANNLKIDIENGVHHYPIYLAGELPLESTQ